MNSSSIFRRIALFGVSFAMSFLGGLLAIGCDSADYTVVKNIKSPDGDLSALIVQRRGHDSLSADVYYVIVTNGTNAMPNLSKAIHDKPILVATHGQDLGLRWFGSKALNIICNSCGIRPIDIMEKKESADSVSITYIGFPNET